jgi:hypothetical protein
VNQLIEVAASAAGGLLLKDHRKSVLIKFLKELVPFDLFQRVVISIFCLGEAEAQNAGLAVPFGAGHFAGNGVSRLGPPAYLIVILGRLRQS